MKKITSMILMASIIFGVFAFAISSKAAGNPYKSSQNVDGDEYYEIPCTYFAWNYVKENLNISLPAWGNGGQWLDNAKNSGYSTGTTAKSKSLAVWQDGGYGHVAYVKSVSGTSMIVAEGGRTDLDQTSSHGVDYGFTTSSTIGSIRPTNNKLVGFIYLDGTSGGLAAPTNVQARLDGKKLVLTWNAVSGANCYDVILTDPSGTTNWYHTTSNKRDIYLTKTGSYSLDVQSLYRPNGSSTGQIVGGHSDKVNFTVNIFGPSEVNIEREGTSIAVTWNPADGANCYDVIVKNPKGEINWYHATDCEKIFMNCIPGLYTFDVQSLYRPNGTSTGQTVGSHSGEYHYSFTLEEPKNLKISNDENDNILVEWDAVDGATCYDIIVTKPDGNTDYLHTHETNKTISNYDFGTYHINVQSLYRENEWTSNQFQVVGGHSDVIDYDYQPTIHHHTLVIDEAIAPGCIEPGKTQGSHCSTCGEIIVKQEVIPALGHVFQTEILNESTCLVTGLKKLTCSVCGEEITETIPVTAHKYESQIIEPTCTHMGYAIFTCKDCHFSYIGEYVERVEHIYHETVITPTTESQGYTVHTCKDCGFSYVDSITDILPSQMHYLIPSLKDINTTLTVKSRENEYMVTASTGVFALDSIKGDIYRVYASQKNSLTVCVGEYDTKLGEVINNEEVFIPLGDVNGDDVIDIADVSVLLSTENYGQTNAELDLTGDNSINIADIAVTLQETNYGKTSVTVV